MAVGAEEVAVGGVTNLAQEICVKIVEGEEEEAEEEVGAVVPSIIPTATPARATPMPDMGFLITVRGSSILAQIFENRAFTAVRYDLNFSSGISWILLLFVFI
mmetsp:Transcript_8304/g.12389  ORF Transcript_8304/g.12389 Transcript_8304/m.12389 type:complete len:103 (-) Transcript_8304:64-372(-)